MTIVIAYEIPVVRTGLKAIAESYNGNRVVAEAGDGVEALRQIEKFKPAVLITNFRLTRLSGLELIRQVCQSYPGTKTIISSHFVSSTDLAQVFQAGALGFINLNCNATDVQKAIQEVHAGRRHLAARGAQTTLSPTLDEQGEATPKDICEKLTNREREVLQLAADGNDRNAIARRLFISQRTVETHRAHFMHKLGLHSQTDLVRFAIRKGIITP
jgi:DNA-binding NarL/FixJ family response regulator